jgi:hypothetical protein
MGTKFERGLVEHGAEPNSSAVQTEEGGCPVETILVELPAHHKGLADAVLAASVKLLEIEGRTTKGRTVDMAVIESELTEAAARGVAAILIKQHDVRQAAWGAPWR